jgi:tRNA 2-thiocytidine biosynthesis protein TtcA
LCGSQENLQRKQIKSMLREWEKKFPGRVDNIFSSLSTIVPSHLMDRSLFDFAKLEVTGLPLADGDIAFDESPCASSSASVNIIQLQPPAADSD